jgi:two-component system sensor histidine kinase AgrC
MYLLVNFFLAIFVHLIFFFVVAKGLTRSWRFSLQETGYLATLGLIIAVIQVFVWQLNIPNIFAHLLNNLNVLMVFFLYLPALFLYYHKIKLYNAVNALSFMAFAVSIIFLSSLIINLAFLTFLPNSGWSFTITLAQQLFFAILHFLLHIAAALGLVILFLILSKNTYITKNHHSRLQTIRICISIAILALLTTVLFIFYYQENLLFQQGYSRNIIIAFILICTIFAGSVFHTKHLNKKRKEDDYQNLMHYVDKLEQQQTAMRKFKHNQQNIILSLQSFIQNKNWAELEHYFFSEAITAATVIAKDHFALEALRKIKIREIKNTIITKLMVAQNTGKNIHTVFEADQDINYISLDSTTLAYMLNILLDNAIEALVEMDGGDLRIGCFKTESEVTFIIQNTCQPNIPSIHKLLQPGFSTKEKHRGLGLANLSELANFHSNIMLGTSIKDGNFRQKLIIECIEKNNRGGSI